MPAPAPRSRAQQETVGIALLTGVVVVVALTVGTVVVAQTAGDDTGPTADVDADATSDELTLWHSGGDPLDRRGLVVVLEQDGTETRFTPGAANLTGGDDRFDPGERVRRDHGLAAGDATVFVVHEPSGALVAEARVVVS